MLPKPILLAGMLVILGATSGELLASPPPAGGGADAGPAGGLAGEALAEAPGPFGFVGTLGRSNAMLGDLFGLRPFLSRYGMTLSIEETSEVLGNLTGGTRRGAAYDGLTQVDLQLDTQLAFGWYGGTFNVSGLQIHGRNLSADNLSTLQTASGIEADRATRLWELWYQQKLLPEDRLDFKVGQQSLDQEFIVSQNALYFVNTSFGWPLIPSVDLPGGGPAYPLSALGVRARFRPTDSVTFLAGVFNGSPDQNSQGDPQRDDPSGTSFPLNGGALVIAELQYAYPAVGSMVPASGQEPLGRTYKLGFWYDTERFSDRELDSGGKSLADPASNGIPLTHSGDVSIYAVADQMVWRSAADEGHNVNVFVRAMGAPQGDRNLATFSLNAGIAVHEPFEHRDSDVFGLAMGYARIGSRAAALDQDTRFYMAGNDPVRGGETFVEATYQYQVTPWLQLQPDAQYVFNPGAGLPSPDNPDQRIKDEVVLGVRTNILF